MEVLEGLCGSLGGLWCLCGSVGCAGVCVDVWIVYVDLRIVYVGL